MDKLNKGWHNFLRLWLAPSVPHNDIMPPLLLCWMLDRQGYGGQDLASACLAGVNECGQRWRRFVVNSPGKQWGRAHPTPLHPRCCRNFHMGHPHEHVCTVHPSQPWMCGVQLLRRQIDKWKWPSVSGRGVDACLLEDMKWLKELCVGRSPMNFSWINYRILCQRGFSQFSSTPPCVSLFPHDSVQSHDRN